MWEGSEYIERRRKTAVEGPEENRNGNEETPENRPVLIGYLRLRRLHFRLLFLATEETPHSATARRIKNCLKVIGVETNIHFEFQNEIK